jgi:glycosyltransferase involved in cell wall biosynthesis
MLEEGPLVNRIWVDVDDLFAYANLGMRPSGIQRLEFELCRALNTLPESKGRVFFVRHDAKRQCLVRTSWEAVEAVYGVLSSGSPEELAATASATGRVLSALRAVVHALPSDLRKIALMQIDVLLGLRRLVRTRAADVVFALKRRWRFPKIDAALSLPMAGYFTDTAEPGDVLAVLGAGWTDFAVCERTVHEKGLRLALLIYDIIPLRRPEWFGRRVTDVFRAWLEDALPRTDAVLTISNATARDVTAYARSAGLALRAVPTSIPIGTGFKDGALGRPTGIVVLDRVPAANSYALVVSTIEVRKNHVLLFRVWRRLLEEMPEEMVPTLVFAGRTGWFVSDLMDQLRNSRFLDGKIIHVESPTDEELGALYEGCLFTLFPSFYEGWGLPVTESHAFGRPCIVSKTTSLPEAGGSLARYIDPENTSEAYKVIRETIEDQAGLRQWRDRVQREFKPVEWSESARAVLRALDGEGGSDAGRANELRWSA